MSQAPTGLESMPESRRAILTALKESGSCGIAELAERIGVTYESVRSSLGHLKRDGWVTRRLDRRDDGPGRPPSIYELTPAGDHLFPKAYDQLAIHLIDAASERLGPAATREMLEEVVRTKVEAWLPRLEGKSFTEKVEALRGIYLADDPYTHVEEDPEHGLRLVETNCPYLEVARHRPALCSVTLSVLRRLLGCEVVRVERFQDGDHRCVFQVLTDRPVSDDPPLLRLEADQNRTTASGS